ncbi:MAG: hypothetical protein Q9160_000896 [Pyrenula sp. 1 TL-2023]
MSAETANSPGDDYFNDLSQGLPNRSSKSQSPIHDEQNAQNEQRGDYVEKLLKTQSTSDSTRPPSDRGPSKPSAPIFDNASNLDIPGANSGDIDQLFAGSMMQDSQLDASFNLAALDNGLPWEMMELGVEEALPSQDIIDELRVLSSAS